MSCIKMTKSSFRIIGFCLLLFCSSNLNAQNRSDEKVLTKLNVKQYEKQLESLSKKSLFPLDVQVVDNRGKPQFSLKLSKPAHPKKFVLRHDLTEDEFLALFRTSRSKKYRLVSHQEYFVKKKPMHLGLWHFDPNLEPPKVYGKSGEVDQPPADPMKPIWNSTSVIPVRGKSVRGFEPVDKLVTDYLRSNQLPGMSLAVAYRGKLFYAKGYGYSDIETMTSLKPDQPMRIGQLARTFTGTAIFKLVDQGKLKLDEKVFDILKTKPFKGINDPNLPNITVAHLLHDTAGFDQEAFDPFDSPRTICRNLKIGLPLKNDQIISFMMSETLGRPPGAERHYSNFGFMLLAKIIEEKSKTSFESFVFEHIFKQLGMNSMITAESLPENRPMNEVSYYARSGQLVSQIAEGPNLLRYTKIPDGGADMKHHKGWGDWAGSATDMVKFATAVRTKNALLTDDSIKLMYTKPAYIPEIGTGGDKGPRDHYSSGWTILDYKNGKFFTRAYGSIPGSSSAMICNSDGATWVMLFNCDLTKGNERARNGLYLPLAKLLNKLKK